MNRLTTLIAGLAIACSVMYAGANPAISDEPTDSEVIAELEGQIDSMRDVIQQLSQRPKVRDVAQALRPCKLEDSENCVWRAGRRGNGEGRSFVNLDGRTYSFGPRH